MSRALARRVERLRRTPGFPRKGAMADAGERERPMTMEEWEARLNRRLAAEAEQERK